MMKGAEGGVFVALVDVLDVQKCPPCIQHLVELRDMAYSCVREPL